MTKTYQIVTMKRETTKTGKNLIRATLATNEGGTPVELDNVTIWDGFPNFSMLNVGSPVTGEYSEKQNGQYVNKALSATKPTARAPKAGITKAMETKAVNIETAQKRKGDSIKIAAVFRDSTLMVVQELAQMTASGVSWLQEDAQRKHREWQKWFNDNYGDSEAPF